jgi:hypothetical protein
MLLSMLPSFPTFCRDLLAFRGGALHNTAASRGVRKLLPEFRQFEGNRFSMRRPGREPIEASFDVPPITASVTLSVEELRKDGWRATERALRGIVDTLDEGLSKRSIEAMESAAAAAGNYLDCRGERLSAEHVLGLYDRMSLSFRQDGSWIEPRVLGNAETLAKYREVLEQIATDPTLRARRDDIINRQRGEWLGREARRALVD